MLLWLEFWSAVVFELTAPHRRRYPGGNVIDFNHAGEAVRAKRSKRR